ncbi:MAG TPA: hypothetical protein PLD53_04760 [Candidatus Propionivibrio aalborgensis]|nr:hypothetical protein [Candidatus Propionivibrio aalborgensis]
MNKLAAQDLDLRPLLDPFQTFFEYLLALMKIRKLAARFVEQCLALGDPAQQVGIVCCDPLLWVDGLYLRLPHRLRMDEAAKNQERQCKQEGSECGATDDARSLNRGKRKTHDQRIASVMPASALMDTSPGLASSH